MCYCERGCVLNVTEPESELRILLVDDSEANRTLFAAYLKRTRCVTDIAENGQIGVDLFATRHYDAVLMDVEMPFMDGYEAVREIRRIENETGASPTPVIALTAHTLADVAAKGYAAGFTKLLSKPIRLEALLEALALPDPIRIRVEEDLRDVVPGYVGKRRTDVAIYRAALDAGDFDAIRKLAHNMKGTGSGYGLPRLTELGASIEAAASRSDASATREHVEEFALFIARVELE